MAGKSQSPKPETGQQSPSFVVGSNRFLQQTQGGNKQATQIATATATASATAIPNATATATSVAAGNS